MNFNKVLLTGGRAPSTLELARFFSKKGIEVHVAESFQASLSKTSRYVACFHSVSKPKQETDLFIQELVEIIEKENIPLLVPTCEEIFYLSQHKERFPDHCQVFVESFSIMEKLHNKFAFIKWAESLGLPVPATEKVSSKKEWKEKLKGMEFNKHYIGKPLYSRFSNDLIFLPEEENREVDVREKRQWVIQERLTGIQLCSYSIVREGELVAHAAYENKYRAGEGASIAFSHVEEPKVYKWVEEFVRKINFTGQIAFDFFKTDSGEVYAIECNPRLTSGIHLFEHTTIADAFLGMNQQVVIPKKEAACLLSFAYLLYALPNIRKNGLKEWWATWRSSKDVVFSSADIYPSVYQLYSYYHFWKISRKKRISVMEATVFDIAWDGDRK